MDIDAAVDAFKRKGQNMNGWVMEAECSHHDHQCDNQNEGEWFSEVFVEVMRKKGGGKGYGGGRAELHKQGLEPKGRWQNRWN